jgi:hypothetical protein
MSPPAVYSVLCSFRADSPRKPLILRGCADFSAAAVKEPVLSLPKKPVVSDKSGPWATQISP